MTTAEIATQVRASELSRHRLVCHWLMDPMAADCLSAGMTDSDHNQLAAAIEKIEPNRVACEIRDEHRSEITDILGGTSSKKLMILGPCSLDEETDYTELFDRAQRLQEEHPDMLIAVRLNGKKPRTRGGWTGLLNSTDTSERRVVYDTYQEAYDRGIAIVTEITDPKQFGALAQYLSAVWIGARDMLSTELRGAASLIHLPTLIKNNNADPRAETVENAMTAIATNSLDNHGSGVDIGVIAATAEQRGFATGVLPVGEGNPITGIIARGYDLRPEGREEELTAEQRRQCVIRHISSLCIMAARRGTIVLIDGSHDVPRMLAIDGKDSDRFPQVLRTVLAAIKAGEIEHAERIAGVVGEIGSTVGRTDPNLITTDDNMRLISELMAELAILTMQLAA